MNKKAINKLLEYNYSNTYIPFLEYSPVYIETNEILSEIFKIIDVDNKDILCVTASGDFALNALAKDASSVTSFDCNKLAKYILSLKEATILTYTNVEEFKKFFSKSSTDFLNKNIFKKISDNLDDDSYKFWCYVYERLSKNCLFIKDTKFIRTTLEEDLVLQEAYNLYYHQEYYSCLRERLKHKRINAKDLNITSLATISDDNFDVIYLSNVLQYYYDIKGLDRQELVHKFIMDEVFPKLKNNGLVGVCYCYWDKMIDYDNKGYDINSYLLKNHQEIYTLETFKSIINNYNEGICLCRKKVK